jgi:hypothetical protein
VHLADLVGVVRLAHLEFVYGVCAVGEGASSLFKFRQPEEKQMLAIS